MELHIKVIGYLLILLALVHSIFPKYFNWDVELRSLSLINREMIYVHTFFIAFALFLMGFLCVTSSVELSSTTLGKKISFGFGAFWLARLIIQFFGYSTKLWRGKTFETFVHIIFSFLWTYLSLVFLLNYFND